MFSKLKAHLLKCKKAAKPLSMQSLQPLPHAQAGTEPLAAAQSLGPFPNVHLISADHGPPNPSMLSAHETSEAHQHHGFGRRLP